MSADAVAAFFDELGRRGHVASLRRLTGTLRVDLEADGATERWLVAVDRGDVSVSRRNAKAGCVIRTDRAVFEKLLAGRANAMASLLRGLIEVEGDLHLLILFQRAFGGRAAGASA